MFIVKSGTCADFIVLRYFSGMLIRALVGILCFLIHNWGLFCIGLSRLKWKDFIVVGTANLQTSLLVFT